MASLTQYLDQTTSAFRVLIVDDDLLQRKLAQAILEAPRYEVFEATNGQEGLDLIQREEFDAVVLDRQMPGMNGEEVCRRIRQDIGNHLLPIIMVTGAGSSALASALRAGATDFIHKPYNAQEFQARVDAAVSRKRLTDQLESAESVLFALARMVEAKDGNTGDHCTRLAQYSVRFGEVLGLGGDELLALRRGGVLHDIGKLGIPEHILLKPGGFTPEEWAVMKTHTLIGERLCSGLRSFRLTVDIIRSHHERWDGSGYPDGLVGEAIPLLARVFQICDIYDALTFERPYKPALPTSEVIRIMREETARGWRDPALMDVFLDLVEREPEAFMVQRNLGDDLGLALFEGIQVTREQLDLPTPVREADK